MGKFIEFLEGRGFYQKGQVGGAFGKSDQFANISQRVSFGKSIEKKIIDTIRQETGWSIEDATANEDKFGKIDGWIINQGKRVPLQVKYRDAGDDIPLEVMKNWSINKAKDSFTGRDMVSNLSGIYAVLSSNRTKIMMRSTDDLKHIASSMYRSFLNEYLRTSARTLTTREGQIKLTRDPATKSPKIMAFINPNAIKGKDIMLNKPIN